MKTEHLPLIGTESIHHLLMSNESKNDISTPDVQLTENKLIITSNAVQQLGVQPGDRVAINYIIRDKSPIPVIGKSSVFNTDEGNKLTKSFTVSFRGEQNKFLRLYGTKFVLVPDNHYFILRNIEKETPEISLDIINK